MDAIDSEKRRLAILEPVIPHLLDPDSYPMPRLSLEDCAALMSVTRSEMNKAERSALAKMRENLMRMGATRVSDVISV